MNKTISINIGGRNFFVEEEGYRKLENYLSAIKGHFAKYPGSGEILADMENRMAEKFLENAKNSPQAVVTLKDVDNLIAEFGTVEDLAPGENSGSAAKTAGDAPAAKRLMRNSDDVVIAGVCSGLAAYFDLDPTIIRVLFIVLVFVWGTAVPLYLILWLLMPEAKTATEKMQMRGQPLNISSLSHSIKERAMETKGTASRLGSGLRTVLNRLADMVKVLIKLAVRLAGLLLVLASALALAGLTFAAAVSIFNVNSPYLSFPMALIAQEGIAYYALVVLAYLIILIPGIFLLLLGAAIFRGRKAITGSVALSLVGFWLLAAISGGVLAVNNVPGYVEKVKNSPQMQTQEKTFDTGSFTAVKLSGYNTYRLKQGSGFSVKASGKQADLDELSVSNNGGSLEIRKQVKSRICIFCARGDSVVEITAPDFANIFADGGAWVIAENLASTSTAITLTGSARANIQASTTLLNLDLGEFSRIRPAGITKNLNATIDNASRLEGLELDAENADVTILNGSSARINAAKTLKYNLDGTSMLRYAGNPRIEPGLAGAEAEKDIIRLKESGSGAEAQSNH